MTFCRELPFPTMKNSTADLPNAVHIGMYRWLLMLLDSNYLQKWEDCTPAYTLLSNSVAGKEGHFFEELSRRVVASSLESLMEQTEHSEEMRPVLEEFIPKIVDQQSIRSQGILSFLMLLELHIYLSAFRTLLVKLFYITENPDIAENHRTVALFCQSANQLSEIRCIMRPEDAMALARCCLAVMEKS